ncbi:maleylpyruvate isomerase family mycothiol-dependent enzyme [Kitasatospora sp. NPDC092286]|uniref:maleylpyruvate isomerase family mycothiol-dependent enzyme n=1 Tax=Kitasatospora sp. NPDC092286 TaxID=3364087 RepID=UPI003809CE83
MEKSDYAAAMRRDTTRFLTAVTGDLGLTVPSCPGWRGADLLWHVGEVYRFWTRVAEGEITDPHTQYTEPERPADDALPGWFAEGAEQCAAVLERLDPAEPRWSWSTQANAGFIQRRMAQEIAVHCWDAVNAVGRDEPVERTLALDGIDELLTLFLPRAAPDGLPEAGLHLHATDAEGGAGEWTLRAVGGSWQLGREHGKAAAAVRGTASDLLLMLWGRRDADRLEVFGDPEVIKAYRAAFELD